MRSRTSALFNISSRVDSPVRTVIVFVTLHTAVPGELGICPLLTTRDPLGVLRHSLKTGVSLSLYLSTYLYLSVSSLSTFLIHFATSLFRYRCFFWLIWVYLMISFKILLTQVIYKMENKVSNHEKHVSRISTFSVILNSNNTIIRQTYGCYFWLIWVYLMIFNMFENIIDPVYYI